MRTVPAIVLAAVSLAAPAAGAQTLHGVLAPAPAEFAASCAAAVPETSAACARAPFALGLLRGETQPELVLAQRAIEREWGLPEGESPTAKPMGWRSESGAMMLSAIAPGAGQQYAGSSNALWFALAEAAGWTARVVLRRSADRARDEAAAFAGAPGDTASGWSLERWEAANPDGAGDLERLYAADPEAFYDLIADDPRYLSGWSGDAAATRNAFITLREASERRLHGARWSETLVWFNHVIAAVDALRAARLNNLKIGHGLGLNVRSGWHHGTPEILASIERRF